MTWNIVGHEWAAHLLQRQISQEQMRHAYLFTGPTGVGRRTLALRFAQALNCLQPPAPGEACGQCRVCQQIARMQQPDLNILQAESEGGVLKIEQVRELRRMLSMAPYESRYRVALLLRFEEANASSQNALLKTLEEAPQRVILMLTADSAESLLPTIVSRCEVMRLRPMPLERLAQELCAQGQPAETANLLAHLAGGRLGYALRLKDNPTLLKTRQSLLEDFEKLLRSPRRQRLRYVGDELLPKGKEDKEKLRLVYQIWLSCWRDLMLCASGAQVPLVNLDWAPAARHLAASMDLVTARRNVSALEQGLLRLDANLNARLLSEVLLLDWPYLS